VLYGLARQGTLPARLSEVSPVTHTPLLATALVGGIVLALALLLPLEHLADLTSRFTLILFALVNFVLICIKASEGAPPRDGYIAPRWVPWAGLAWPSCLPIWRWSPSGALERTQLPCRSMTRWRCRPTMAGLRTGDNP
jgi:amino acid transporter